MRSARIIFYFLLFSFALPGLCETYDLRVKSGDKTTEFKIITEVPVSKILANDSEGLSKEMKLSPKNSRYLEDEIKTILAMPSNDPSLCSRSYILLSSPKKSVVGCIQSPTQIAQRLVKLANLIDVAIKL